MAKLSRTRSAGLLPQWLGRPLSWIARLLYNVSTSGLENLPERGGVLLVANHMSYVDGVVLQLACPRPIRFVGDDDYRRSHWFARRIFRLTGTIPLGPRSTLSGTRRILAALQAGAWGVHIPHALTWSYERADPPTDAPRFRVIQRLAELPDVVNAVFNHNR